MMHPSFTFKNWNFEYISPTYLPPLRVITDSIVYFWWVKKTCCETLSAQCRKEENSDIGFVRVCTVRNVLESSSHKFNMLGHWYFYPYRASRDFLVDVITAEGNGDRGCIVLHAHWPRIMLPSCFLTARFCHRIQNQRRFSRAGGRARNSDAFVCIDESNYTMFTSNEYEEEENKIETW